MENPEIPYIIEFPRIQDPRGNLSFMQNGHDFLPFDIQRAFWIYDVPGGESRGSHSHKSAKSIIIAVGGSFEVDLYDGMSEYRFVLNKPYEGLYVPPGFWHTLNNFSSGAVCLTLTSIPYCEDDYVRDFEEFKRLKQCGN